MKKHIINYNTILCSGLRNISKRGVSFNISKRRTTYLISRFEFSRKPTCITYVYRLEVGIDDWSLHNFTL